jgi:hypothetical protein
MWSFASRFAQRDDMLSFLRYICFPAEMFPRLGVYVLTNLLGEDLQVTH